MLFQIVIFIKLVQIFAHPSPRGPIFQEILQGVPKSCHISIIYPTDLHPACFVQKSSHTQLSIPVKLFSLSFLDQRKLRKISSDIYRTRRLLCQYAFMVTTFRNLRKLGFLVAGVIPNLYNDKFGYVYAHGKSLRYTFFLFIPLINNHTDVIPQELKLLTFYNDIGNVFIYNFAVILISNRDPKNSQICIHHQNVIFTLARMTCSYSATVPNIEIFNSFIFSPKVWTLIKTSLVNTDASLTGISDILRNIGPFESEENPFLPRSTTVWHILSVLANRVNITYKFFKPYSDDVYVMYSVEPTVYIDSDFSTLTPYLPRHATQTTKQTSYAFATCFTGSSRIVFTFYLKPFDSKVWWTLLVCIGCVSLLLAGIQFIKEKKISGLLIFYVLSMLLQIVVNLHEKWWNNFEVRFLRVLWALICIVFANCYLGISIGSNLMSLQNNGNYPPNI
ncbi:hypothetical protein Fcan01_23352 [Folsomia candida]|uniref:Uncharacterized protein n=1 Tax=Folsomia candida TaxID=158441 RepID=A0A226D9V6_FOLCA|nr:hypothetical protein Fcan01_23352 [Folsomia candida]